MRTKMNLQEKAKKLEGERGKSLRERAEKSRLIRKKKIRNQMLLLGMGLALIVIMILFVHQVVSFNSSSPSDMAAADASNKQSVSQDKNQPKKDKEEPTETPEPTKPPQAEGTDKWLRKDLDAEKPMVALTFDDGPYAPVTEKILATLKKYDAKATFFCVGNRVPGYSAVVKQAYRQGCQLASHTYEHKILTSVKKKQIIWQVKKVDATFEEIIGCHTTALRPPGGAVNDKVKKNVQIPLVCWNVDSEDWKSRNTKKILSRCRSIEDGDIVLMHDLYPTTANAVEKLVPELKKKGFQIVTVDELFYYKGIKAEGGTVYFSGK